MPAIGTKSAAREDAIRRRDDDYRRLLEQRSSQTASELAHRVAVSGHGRMHQAAARPRLAAADRARITTRRHG